MGDISQTRISMVTSAVVMCACRDLLGVLLGWESYHGPKHFQQILLLCNALYDMFVKHPARYAPSSEYST